MNKKVNIISLIYLIYFVFSIIIYAGLFLYNFINGAIICLPSPYWFAILIIIIPIILLLLPLILEKIFKNEKKSLMLAICLSIIYIAIIIPSVHFGIIKYAKEFNTDKWNEMRFLRYLMIEDLEDNYNLINMTITELDNLLGKADKESGDTLCYFIKDDLNDQYYCIKVENNLVIDNFILKQK